MIDETKKVSVSLIDINGKIVATYQLDFTNPIEVIGVAAGYYSILISDGKVKQEMKILVD